MQIPLKIEVHGVRLSSHVRQQVALHLKKIERLYGRITACRVAIRAPDTHHRAGEPFPVAISIVLPGGRQLETRRISNNRDPRQSDIAFAVDDAFRRILRQLQHQASKQGGLPKTRRGAQSGTIASLKPAKSCGFLTGEDGREIYFHAHSVLGGKFEALLPGQSVTFHEERGEKGPQASTVRVLRRRKPVNAKLGLHGGP